MLCSKGEETRETCCAKKGASGIDLVVVRILDQTRKGEETRLRGLGANAAPYVANDRNTVAGHFETLCF